MLIVILWAVPRRTARLCLSPCELISCYCCKLNNMIYGICDAPNLGCPLTTRQPAEIYMSHVMRPILVQKWPLGPTHHTHKMYILYKNDLITICLQLYLITIYTKMGLLPRIFTKYKIRPVWSFLRF